MAADRIGEIERGAAPCAAGSHRFSGITPAFMPKPKKVSTQPTSTTASGSDGAATAMPSRLGLPAASARIRRPARPASEPVSDNATVSSPAASGSRLRVSKPISAQMPNAAISQDTMKDAICAAVNSAIIAASVRAIHATNMPRRGASQPRLSRSANGNATANIATVTIRNNATSGVISKPNGPISGSARSTRG